MSQLGVGHTSIAWIPHGVAAWLRPSTQGKSRSPPSPLLLPHSSHLMATTACLSSSSSEQSYSSAAYPHVASSWQ